MDLSHDYLVIPNLLSGQLSHHFILQYFIVSKSFCTGPPSFYEIWRVNRARRSYEVMKTALLRVRYAPYFVTHTTLFQFKSSYSFSDWREPYEACYKVTRSMASHASLF